MNCQSPKSPLAKMRRVSSQPCQISDMLSKVRWEMRGGECYFGDQMWCQHQLRIRGYWHMSAPYMCTHVITYICNTCEVWAPRGVRGDSLVNLDLTFQTRRGPRLTKSPQWNNLSSSSLTATRMNEARKRVILGSWVSPTCLKLAKL